MDGDGTDVLSAARAFLDGRGWDPRAIAFIMSDASAIIDASSDQSPRYTLRLEYVTDDACRKFHKDNTDIRLITTYLGRGSQWIETRPEGPEPEIREMATFEVGMFLGERCNRQDHVFHRSPPIEDTVGSERFLMVIDVERPEKC